MTCGQYQKSVTSCCMIRCLAPSRRVEEALPVATYAPLQLGSAPMTGAPSEVDGRKQACAMSSLALPKCVEMFRAMLCTVIRSLRQLTRV